VVNTDNQVSIGNATTTTIGGSVNWTATSDGRFKRDLREDVPGMDFINQLRPVTYTYDIRSIYEFEGKSLSAGQERSLSPQEQRTYTGLVAQEVWEAARKLGYDFSGVDIPDDPDTEKFGLRYAELVVPLVKAVQELDQLSNNQQDKIAQQQAMISDIIQQINRMEARLEQVKQQQAMTQK
jgi:hypothetical protein